MENPIRSTTVSQGSFGPPPVVAAIPEEALSSGVSWAAVAGGSAVIAALSVTLLALGAGLGFASVSPWANQGASAATIGAGAILWLIVMQVIASGMGGYLAGRLRARWTRIHSDEVFFRDTAHGFLSWCLAAVVTAAFLATAATLMTSAAIAGTTAAPTATITSTAVAGNDYYVDALFRLQSPSAASVDPMTRAEASRILAYAMANPETAPQADINYLASVIAARTGLSQAAAQQHVSNVIVRTKQDMDVARKAAAHVSIWSFVALLVGALAASYAATIGGRQRDGVVTVN
jgi:hypothetical protein